MLRVSGYCKQIRVRNVRFSSSQITPFASVNFRKDGFANKIILNGSPCQETIEELRTHIRRANTTGNITSKMLVLRPTVKQDLENQSGQRFFMKPPTVSHAVESELIGNKHLQLYHELRGSQKFTLSVIDGLASDIGASIAIMCRGRVATTTSCFQALTVQQALEKDFIDPGLIHKLANMDYGFGLFLALTGFQLEGRDLWHAGLANHFIPYERLPQMMENLTQLHDYEQRTLENVMSYFSADPQHFSLASQLPFIEKCFSEDTVENIILALESEEKPFSNSIALRIRNMPPVYLKLTHAALVSAKKNKLSELDCLEYGRSIVELKNQIFKPGHDVNDKPKSLVEVESRMISQMLPQRNRYKNTILFPPHTSTASLKSIRDMMVYKSIYPLGGDPATYLERNLGHASAEYPFALKGVLTYDEVHDVLSNNPDKRDKELGLEDKFHNRLTYPENHRRLYSFALAARRQMKDHI